MTDADRDGRGAETTTKSGGGAVLSGLMRPLNNLVERFIPSALVFAIVLTFVVVLLALLLTDAGPVSVVEEWGNGLAGLLAFMTQMALILFLGYILASTRPVHKILVWLAKRPNTAMQAYLLVFVVAALASLITWGLGLVAGALLAREVAYEFRRREEPVHFAMLVAAAFSGFVVWHMGYSASGPLLAATPDSFVAEQLGEPLPVTETIFTPWNIAAAAATIVLVAVALTLVAPRRREAIVPLKDDPRDHEAAPEEEVATHADRVDASRLPTLLTGLMLVAYLVIHFSGGGTLTLDIDRKSTRLNSSHVAISYAVFCLKKKTTTS